MQPEKRGVRLWGKKFLQISMSVRKEKEEVFQAPELGFSCSLWWRQAVLQLMGVPGEAEIHLQPTEHSWAKYRGSGSSQHSFKYVNDVRK